MNEFASCIEYLLLTHDSVVVPGLGAFITQQMPARYVEEEHLLLPPFRIVRFNKEIASSGNNMVQEISALFNLSPDMAEERLSRWVMDLMQALDDTGVCDFGSLGVFTMEGDEDIVFTSSEAGIMTPAYYGLDAFRVETLQGESPEEQDAFGPADRQEDKGGSIVIRLNRRLVHFAAAACAAVLLFFMISTPVENTEAVSFSQQAEFFIPLHLVPSSPLPPTQSILQETLSLEQETPAEETVTDTPAADEQAPGTGYCVVVASLVSQANAARYVKDLSSRGFSNPRVLEGKMRRVVIGSYQTKEEAAAAASELRGRGKEFASAWVLTL